MDKFINKDGKVVMTITDSNEVEVDEKHFKDAKEKKCNHDTTCPACAEPKED